MHVGVKEAVAQRMAQESLDQRAGDLLQIQSLGLQPRAVGQWRGVDPFQRQHVLGGAVPIDRRHAEIRIVLGILGHFRKRRRFQPEIHFDRDRTGERIDDFAEAKPPRLGGQIFRVLRGKGESGEVGMEARFDIRPQYFHGDVARSGRGRDGGAMHLRDRGGGNRGPEARKHRGHRLVERGGDHRFGLGLRERRHPVLQAFEVAGQYGADDVRPRCQKLTELHIGRAEPGQRHRQPRLRRAGRGPLEQARDADERARRGRNGGGIDDAENAFAGEHKAGAAKADEMRGSRNHKRQPECNVTMPPLIG